MIEMEGTNGRPASEAPSSSSDFYETNPPGDQPSQAVPEEHAPFEQEEIAIALGSHEDADDDDSSSEMDVSVSSRSASPEPLQEPAPHTGTKRKFSDAADAVNGLPQAVEDPPKKVKLSTGPPSPVHQPVPRPKALPAGLWQNIFLYLPPAILCRLLRVSKSFNAFLTSTKAPPAAKKDQAKIRILDSESIWTQARKTWFPNLPRPLSRCTELEMLQLVGGKTCQFCHRLPTPSPATSPFNAGPGSDGLRVIWPFGIRACGRCLEVNTFKDVQILVSPASKLRPGLPYSFLTPEKHFVPEIQRQMPGGIPAHLRVAKVYYSKDVDAIMDEYNDANSFGNGAAEEWTKGLHTKGKEAMADAARWEKWEGQMRLGSDLTQVLREYDLSSFPRYLQEAQSKSAGVNGAQPVVAANGAHPLPQPVHAFQNGYLPQYQMPPQQAQPVHRPMRNAHEVEEARQARKADIERRCMALEPPLEPSVLQHIESFQNAMQITMPMTDPAWEVLKSRIIAQRDAAEQVEHQRSVQLAALQAAIPFSAPNEPYSKPAKEVYDKEYERAQEPLRKRLGEYADDFINGQWAGGRGLDKESSPVFAVQTILHVRQRFLEDKESGLIPATESFEKTGSKQGTPTPDPFLSLDNMKWVYDNKVRTLTDGHKRELFICNGCNEDQKRPKWFAFEGLIQHYGAKHVTAFSKGNIVVHWQTAEWPEVPPFNPNPSSYIKPDRKASDHKGHGKARNTPHASRDGPFVAPGSGKLLSESPFFSSHTQQSPQSSNGYFNPSPAYPTYQYGQPSPHSAPYGYPYQAPAPPEPLVDMSDVAQLNKLSSDCREIWDSLDGVRDLLECVRVHAMLNHAVTRSTDLFHRKPNLDLVTDALTTKDEMRPIKNALGLACKTCVASQADGAASYQSYYARIRNVKLYNVSSLITHFKIVHQPHGHAGHQDWTKDMVELPETQLISDLIRAPGMDDDKLAIVAAAFPHAFPSPLPKIGLVQEPPSNTGSDSGLASRLFDEMTHKKKQPQPPKKKKGSLVPSNGTPVRGGSQEPLPPPTEDEYDPRRPMYVQTLDQADPARFDTDVARKISAGTSLAGNNTSNLAPETLAALSNLSQLTSHQQRPQQLDGRVERSPSVGRTEQVNAPAKPTGASSTAPPDIAAILASLTGQTATPPTTSSRSGSAPKYAPDPYGPPHQVSPRGQQQEQHSTTRYAPQPTYRGSAEPPNRYEGHDHHAAASTNARHFEQNRTQHYAEQPYVSQQQSPPRYRYVYDDGQAYSQPQPQTPAYHHEAPVQYVQLPAEHDRAPQSQPAYHHYERPSPAKPIYVDQYGRPVQLVPYDSAPAPIQYAPHPYEQQYAQRAPEPAAYSPQSHLQPAYEDRRQVYYEANGPPPSATAAATRYVYDHDGARSSVPRG